RGKIEGTLIANMSAAHTFGFLIERAFNHTANRVQRHLIGKVMRICKEAVWAGLCSVLLSGATAYAQDLGLPESGGPDRVLGRWRFTDTNWLGDNGVAPRAYTNILNVVASDGNGNALQVDSTNAAFLKYNLTESTGSNNIALTRGTVALWLKASWSGTNQGGAGPGVAARVMEV